jgi:hypothetical protein
MRKAAGASGPAAAQASSPPPHVRFAALDALLVLFIANLVLQPLVEPDFGWHLRTGLDLIAGGWTLPATDPYSHTMPDWPWVEHAWLTDGLLGLIYRGLGPAGALGAILFFALVAAGAFGLVLVGARAGRTARLLALAGILWTALPFLGARTQLVTLLGMAGLLLLWRRSRDGRPAQLWAVPPLFLLWANLHGGFTAGLFTLGLILAASVLLRLAVERRPSLAARLDEPVPAWGQVGRLAAVLGLSVLATLVNPYGWRLYGEILASLSDRYMVETLHEWQPVSFGDRAGAIYGVYLALLAVGAAMAIRRVEPVRWVVLIVFLWLSLRHWRNVLLFLLVSAPLAAEVLAASGGWVAARCAARWRDRLMPFLAACVAAAVLLVLGGEHLVHVAQCGLRPAAYFRQTEYPIEAVEWVRANRARLGSRLYNDYGVGGFLLWWLPEEKVFIDGRMPAFRVGDRWIFKDYMDLTAQEPPDLRVLDKYRVDWAMVGRDLPLDRGLARRSDWERVYEDAKVRLYVKRA